MSIKGITEDLFIGKKEISIITLLGSREAVEYVNMKRIDYKYAETRSPGFIDFITKEKKRRFKFNGKSNDKIGQAVDYIANACPELSMVNVTNEDLVKEHSAMLFIINGYKELGLSSQSVIIKQRSDGGVYFNDDNRIYYSMTAYEWSGPEYNKIINASGQTSSNSETKKKGKALKIGLGAQLLGARSDLLEYLLEVLWGQEVKEKSRRWEQQARTPQQLKGR